MSISKLYCSCQGVNKRAEVKKGIKWICYLEWVMGNKTTVSIGTERGRVRGNKLSPK